MSAICLSDKHQLTIPHFAATVEFVIIGEVSPLDLITEAVCQQRCILFLGAGVHAPPPERSPYHWPLEHCPTLGADLSAELARQCGLDKQYPQEDPGNLARVATFFENRFSRQRLVEVLAQNIQIGRRPSPMLRALAELDFPIIVTTNPDTHSEEALREVKNKTPFVYLHT